MRSTRNLPSGYAELRAYLGEKTWRKLCHNTSLALDDDGSIVVRLHGTDIVTFYPAGHMKLNSGGYRTVTTKARMNAVLPMNVRVFQKAHEWYVSFNGERRPFSDDMTVAAEEGPDVRIENHGSLMLFRLETVAAREWVDEHVSDDAQWFGGALVVEPRYAADLADGMSADGLEVR